MNRLAEPLARAGDPSTSKRAAVRMRGLPCRSHYVAIMGALWRPMTGKDIARLTGLTFEQVARRLPELQTRGEIRPTGVERDGCREWERVVHA